jgi:hypothetical protein
MLIEVAAEVTSRVATAYLLYSILTPDDVSMVDVVCIMGFISGGTILLSDLFQRCARADEEDGDDC